MKKILIIIAALTLILASCANNNDQNTSETPFAGGVEGLSASFVKGAPPQEVFDNGQFPFSVTLFLENLGEHDVPTGDGYVEITGINPIDFDLDGQADLRQDIPTEIDGVVKNFQGTILLGDKVDVSFDDLNYLPNLRGNFPAKIRANLCYNYETTATTYLCVKRDLLSNIGTKSICELSGEKRKFNSGSPIQVSAVEQNPAGSDKLQVIFTVSHVGFPEDRFYKVDTECDDSEANPNKDLVWFEVVSDLVGEKASCTGLRDALADKSGGYIELTNGADTQVVCSFDVSGIESIFETPVNVKLDYRYYQFIETDLLIKDVSVGSES